MTNHFISDLVSIWFEIWLIPQAKIQLDILVYKLFWPKLTYNQL